MLRVTALTFFILAICRVTPGSANVFGYYAVETTPKPTSTLNPNQGELFFDCIN